MEREAERLTGTRRTEWKQMLSGAGLVASVAAILVLAAVREIDEVPGGNVIPSPSPSAAAPSTEPAGPPDTAPEAASEPAPPSGEPAETAAPGLPRRAPADTLLDMLSRRTLEDPVRLSQSGGSFTLQLAVACRRDTAHRLLERAGGSDRLFVLPATVGTESCFRFCWGAYKTREMASKAADLPASLRSGLGPPSPRRIGEMIP